MKAKQKIPEISLEDLNKLAKGKKIFEFSPLLLEITKINVQSLIGKKYSSIVDACILESRMIICQERKSYQKTILEFFSPDSNCAKNWFISKIKWGIETLVKIGDPHKNRVTPIGIYHHPLEKEYVLLNVSKEIHFLWEVWYDERELPYLKGLEPIKK